MKLSDLNPFTKVADGFVNLASEYIEDKDKRNEFLTKQEALVNDMVKSAREHDKASYGIKLVDIIRGLIRPIITVEFSTMYIVAKLVPSAGIEFNEYDYAILGVVLTFWFGDRVIKNFKKKV